MSSLVLIHVRNDGCLECTEPLDTYAAVTAESADDPTATESEFFVSACGCDPSLREQLAEHGYSVSAEDWSGGRATLHTLPAVRNLTPHPITLVVGDRSVTLPTDGPPARVVRLPDIDDGNLTVDGLAVPLRRTALGTEVTDLPDPTAGVVLVVARLVCEALPARDDLVFVDGVVRDEQGRIIGATALARAAR